MNDQPGPSGGTVLAAVFLILAGLCLTLLGGGCTLIFLSDMQMLTGAGGYFPLFLFALAILGGGIAMIWLGVKLLRGGFNRP
jgi:hypothetical protein